MRGLTVRWSLIAAPDGVAPSSQFIGSAPTLIGACEIVAVAEGASGFVESAISSR
jgi:hypothetical protein